MKRPVTILVTRPEPAASVLTGELIERGYEVVKQPLTKIEYPNISIKNVDSYDGIILTSQNALGASAASEIRKTMPLYVVGEKTAAMAKGAGFKNIVSVCADAASLEAEIKALSEQRLLYLSAEHISRSFDTGNVSADRKVVYTATEIEHWDKASLHALDSGKVNIVILMSVRSAEIFKKHIVAQARTEAMKSIKSLCISDSVVKSISDLNWKDVQVPDAPNIVSMLEKLQRMNSKSLGNDNE